MLERLKKEVCEANLDLVKEGLVVQTFGNASGVDRRNGLMVIKPSGVPYHRMKPAQMVVVSLVTGEVIEGSLNPSSDTPTHLVLYRAFHGIAGIVHTHSFYATAWAQAGRNLPAFGTTHADYFDGPVPCTRRLTPPEINSEYEANTGKVIVEAFARRDPLACAAVLVASHAPFTWGKTVGDAVHNAVILEHLARLASETLRVFPSTRPMQQVLLNKHFYRKHGPGAYYGQGARANTTRRKPQR
ncbi:MAG TPA: L-ribulose-5-phosphate 4-epimerase [Verrucomicrobiae bacterium]